MFHQGPAPTIGGMTKGRTARLLAVAAMASGLVAIAPAQAGAQPDQISDKAHVGATPAGWATENHVKVKASDLPLAQRKATRAAADDQLFISTPASASAQTPGGAVVTTVVAIDNDTQQTSSLAWRTWSPAAGWGEWQEHAGPGSSILGTPTATWSPDGSQLDVFLINDDSAVYQATYSNRTGTWSPWTYQGGQAWSSPSAKWTSGGTRLDIFMIGAGPKLFQKYWTNTAGWHDWNAINDGPPGGIWSGPSATWTASGARLDIFIVGGANQHLYQWTWSTSTGWTRWTDLGGVLADGVAAEWVADGSRIDIFGVGAGGRLFQKYWTTSAGWRDWTGFPSPPTGVCECVPSISWVPDASHLDVFTLDNVQTGVGYYNRPWNRGSGWAGWQNLFTS
jgi:hypothetical protein